MRLIAWKANVKGNFGEQDVYEFVLDRSKLFAGKHGLRPVGPDEAAQPFFSWTAPH